MKAYRSRSPPPFESSVFFRYLVAGGLAAIVQVVTLFVLVQFINASQTALSGVAFMTAVAANYMLQRSFTFGSDAPHGIIFPRFAAVAFIGFFLNIGIFYALSQFLHYLPSQCLTIMFVLVFNFLLNRTFVFAHRR